MSVAAWRGVAVALTAGLALSLLAGAGAGRVMAADPIVLPPGFEARSSASGHYVLEIELRAGGKPHAARATARLWEHKAPARQLLWSRDLRHRPRPRFALVGNDGQVVLLDEWLNVRSELAVTVIDKHNRTLAEHDLEAVRAALDVPIGALAPRARHGAWIQSPPAFSAQADTVEVAAADRWLLISLRDGALTIRR